MRKNGFTLIEMLVTLALLVIIAGIVYPFFFSNNKTLNSVQINSQLQQEAQQLIEHISKNAREASGIALITDENGIDIKDRNIASYVNTIALNDLNGSRTYSLNNGIVTYNSNEIARNVDNIKITPLDGQDFKNCSGIKIEVILLKNKETYSFNSIVQFRNK